MRRTPSSLLPLDVDGVISLFGFDHDTPPPGRFVMVDGIPHYLSADAGAHLARLAAAFQCVWCSGWEEKANEHLPPALGLAGPFPHLILGEPAPSRHWKLAADAYAGAERPLAWVDDAHDASCRAWARERRGATLLVGAPSRRWADRGPGRDAARLGLRSAVLAVLAPFPVDRRGAAGH